MRYLLFLGLFSFSFLNSQEKIFEIDLSSDYDNYSPKEVISIANKDNDGTALFFSNRKYIFAKFLNDKNKLVSVVGNIEMPKRTKLYIGNTYLNNEYTFYFTNKRFTKFSKVIINLDTRNFQVIEDFSVQNFKNESILSILNEENKLFILSVSKRKDQININTINNSGKINTNQYVFDSDKLKGYFDKQLILHDMFFNTKSSVLVSHIQKDLPNSLEKTSAITKTYFRGDKLYFTNNSTPVGSFLFELDILNGDSKLTKINNGNFSKKNQLSRFNSFFFEDKLLTIYSSKESIFFNVLNANSGEILKSHTINKNEEFKINNTPIILEKGDFLLLGN